MDELGVAAKPRGLEGAIPKPNGSEPDSEALRSLLQALTAMRDGDFFARLPAYEDGLLGRISEVFNTICSRNARIAQQLEQVGRAVGKEGRARQRVKFGTSTPIMSPTSMTMARSRLPR